MWLKSLFVLVVLSSALGCNSKSNLRERLVREQCCSSMGRAIECKLVPECRELVWDRLEAAPVSIQGYGEALCPDTRRWITSQLYPTWMKLGQIMDLKLVYYGKAETTRDPTREDYSRFTCQHGPNECRGNILITCAMHIYSRIEQWLPFADCCARKAIWTDVNGVIKSCANASEMNFTKIDSCATGLIGNRLEVEAGVATKSLNPPLTWVPWITLKDRHTEHIQEQGEYALLRFVCDNYKGKKPAACVPLHAGK